MAIEGRKRKSLTYSNQHSQNTHRCTRHRCVDYSNMSLELLNSSKGGDESYTLSRPLEAKEQTDFFMSHSWYDSPEEKWKALSAVADEFHKKNKRYPTFWLDKCCIDQQNIGDSLKVLPVFVMASKKMLVLAGPSYMSRLWCVWELFTLFAFSMFEVAMSRVHLVVLGGEDGTRKGEIENTMKGFNQQTACCYDPNEENKLKSVIATIGSNKFDERIREMSMATIK